jgi:hypothetical protein
MHHPQALVVGSISTTEIDCNPLDSVPHKFKNWPHIRSKEAAKPVREHTPYNHNIDLNTGKTSLWGPCFTLSEKELEVLRKKVKEMSATGKIRRSRSPATVPILLFPKAPGRGLRLCVDYRKINKIMIVNCIPLQIMSEFQDLVCHSKIFTKIDLKNSHPLICIKEVDEWKNRFPMQIGIIRIPRDAVRTYKYATLRPSHDNLHLEGPLRQSSRCIH